MGVQIIWLRGEIEIVALSRALNRNIFVHCVRYKEPICHVKIMIMQGHTSAVGDDIHLVFYESAYLLGGHYNSVTKLWQLMCWMRQFKSQWL